MTRRQKWSLGTILAAALMTAGFVAGEGGGYVHMESTAFLRVYNDSSRPMVNILFDPLVTDWNAYQARELSYLVDCLDARFIYFCARLGLTHFYSLSALLIIMLCVAIQQYFLEKDFPALPPWLCSALSLAFAAAPACRSYVFFRSAKPLTALAATALCFGAWHLFVRRDLKSGGRGAWATLAFALFLAPLADRQGAFLTACFAGMCGCALVAASFEPVRKFFRVSEEALKKLRVSGILGGAAMLFATLYNLYLAPAVIRALNGYDPSFEFQNIGGGGVFNFQEGGLFLLDNLGFFFVRIFGAVAFCGGLLLLIIWGVFWFERVKREPRQLPAALLTAGCVAAMLLCANLMTYRHHLMLRDDVIHGAYFLPMAAVLVFLAALAAVCAGSRLLNRILAAMLILSLAAAALEPWLSRPATEDHLKLFKETSPLVRKAMNDPDFNADAALLPYSSLKLVKHFRANAAARR